MLFSDLSLYIFMACLYIQFPFYNVAFDRNFLAKKSILTKFQIHNCAIYGGKGFKLFDLFDWCLTLYFIICYLYNGQHQLVGWGGGGIGQHARKTHAITDIYINII